MFKNYLLIVWCNIMYNKLYIGIIFVGLVVGLICVMLVVMFVCYELSYDWSILYYECIYCVGFQVLENGVYVIIVKLVFVVVFYVKDNVVGIEVVVCMYFLQGNQFWVICDEVVFNQDDVYFVDFNVFLMFLVEFIEGSVIMVFDQFGKVVLICEVVEKYFGMVDVVGKCLILEGINKVDVVVLAVVENLLVIIYFNYCLLVFIDMLKMLYMVKILDMLVDVWVYMYIWVEEGCSCEQVMFDLQVLFKCFQDVYEVFILLLVCVDDIYLCVLLLDNEMKINGDINMVYVYVVIVLVMLLVVVVNFMNLVIVCFSCCVKEVGICKVFGVMWGQLVVQFMIEVMVLILVVFVILVLLVMVLILFFGGVLGCDLYFILFSDLLLLGGLLLVVVIVVLLLGSYFVLYLFVFELVKVFKGDVICGCVGVLFCKLLVIFQFCVLVVLVVVIVVVFVQMCFVEVECFGYNKEQVVMLILLVWVVGQYDVFWQQLLFDLLVWLVVGFSCILIEYFGDMMVLQIDGVEYVMYYYLFVEEDFFFMYEVVFVVGWLFVCEWFGECIIVFIEENLVIQVKLVVNEFFVKVQGWLLEDVIGKIVDIQFSEDLQWLLIKIIVIGVVNEMYFILMCQKSCLVVFVVLLDIFCKVFIKVDVVNIDGVFKYINMVWDCFVVGELMEVQFFDVCFDVMYYFEKCQVKVFIWLVGLIIVIVVFGLYGLVFYFIEWWIKEIGICKVLGVSNVSIVMLFIKEYSWLVLLVNVIGWLIVYMVMWDWFNGFEYCIDMNVVFFVIVVLVIFMVVWLIVFMQVYVVVKVRLVNLLCYE